MKDKILKDPNFSLSSEVKLESFRNNRVVEVGYGKLTLNRTHYIFDGMIDSKEEKLTFEVKNAPTLPSDIGINVQIYEGNQLYQFIFSDPKLPTMFVLAGEFMYQLYKKA